MFSSQRVFISDGGTLTDVTLDAIDFREGNVSTALTTDDYLYVASERPFNSRYFKMSTASVAVANASVEIWGGNGWFSAIDVVDDTEGFTKDGMVRFNLDRENRESWKRETDSKDVTDVGSQVDVFEMYWMRLSFSADLSGTTALRHIGMLFSEDIDLFSYYPTLRSTSLMNAWETAKTDWTEQAFSASREIQRELRRKSITTSSGAQSLMETGLYEEASIHKTASIIFRGLGSSYAENEAAAINAFNIAMQLTYFHVDKSGDGTLSPAEKQIKQGFMKR